MARLSFLTLVLLIALSMSMAENDIKFRNINQKRLSRSIAQIRSLRNLVGKLIDTETNVIYNMDGQKQQDTSMHVGATTVPPLAHNLSPNLEEIACLAACNSCVEDYPIGNRKKRAADNCGPMCDCADSCFRMPVEQVGKIYAQNFNAHKDKDCWWRTYSEMIGK